MQLGKIVCLAKVWCNSLKVATLTNTGNNPCCQRCHPSLVKRRVILHLILEIGRRGWRGPFLPGKKRGAHKFAANVCSIKIPPLKPKLARSMSCVSESTLGWYKISHRGSHCRIVYRGCFSENPTFLHYYAVVAFLDYLPSLDEHKIGVDEYRIGRAPGICKTSKCTSENLQGVTSWFSVVTRSFISSACPFPFSLCKHFSKFFNRS